MAKHELRSGNVNHGGLRLGKRDPIEGKPALMLRAILSGKLPEVPAQVDHLGIGGWRMGLNNRYGTCVAVTWANERRLYSRLAGAEHYPDDSSIEALYRTQNPHFPSDDNGMVISEALDYLRKTGGPDGVKALAFAKVDHTNPDEVKAAMAIFGAVWVGVQVSSANMDQFNSEQPWDYVKGSPIEGGHSIIVGGYDSDGQGGDERFVTWAAETAFTDAFWSRQVDEAWVVIWPEHLGTAQFMEGIDQAALGDAFAQLTGGTFPAGPQPEPTPPQPVDPTVDVADRTLAAAVADWLDHHRHSGEAKQVAEALKVWREAKGLAGA